MKAGLQIGEVGIFMGTRIRCEENEERLGKLRCTQCAFEDFPVMCLAQSCWPMKRTKKYFRICDGHRYKKNNTKKHTR
jgi:hypothetical protein